MAQSRLSPREDFMSRDEILKWCVRRKGNRTRVRLAREERQIHLEKTSQNILTKGLRCDSEFWKEVTDASS